MEWTTDDWDPALRFWTLPYDRQLDEWLKATDPSLPSIFAAREFGGQPRQRWRFTPSELETIGWLEGRTGPVIGTDLDWRPDPADPAGDRARAWDAVKVELEELRMLMQDDRDRYLEESEEQADGLADYIIAFIGADSVRHPWTIELVACGLAIGNIAYMYYKAMFKRVRPSVLCPGLAPPFGPPAHPSFPSGHSFLGHFIALLLLEIPGLFQRYGVFVNVNGGSINEIGRRPVWGDLGGNVPIESPLLWLSQRLAKNRERIGVHYPSDSTFSRHLAAGIWDAIFHRDNPDLSSQASGLIECPTLHTVLEKATAEWPAEWAHIDLPNGDNP